MPLRRIGEPLGDIQHGQIGRSSNVGQTAQHGCRPIVANMHHIDASEGRPNSAADRSRQGPHALREINRWFSGPGGRSKLREMVDGGPQRV